MVLGTLADIINDTLLRLSEAQNSPAGGLSTGTGGALALTTTDTITRLTNEAIGDLCRTGGLVIPDTGSVVATVGAAFVPYFSLAVPSGNRLWAARDVSFGGFRLRRIAPGQFAVKYNLSVAAATPAEWSLSGTEGFALGPAPSTAGVTIASGLALPPALVNAADTITPYLPVDLRRILSYSNAYYIAVMNKDAGTLLGAAPGWQAEYEAGKALLLGRLARLDPAVYQAYYAGGG
jgi:hypothetical protein